MTEIAIITALLLTAVGFALFSSRTIDRADSRDEVSRHLFLAAFDGSGAPAELLANLFDALRRRAPGGVAVLRPADQLAALYGFTQADAEDVALLVAARAEARIPDARDLDYLAAHVQTVADLVRFLMPFCAPAPRPLAKAS